MTVYGPVRCEKCGKIFGGIIGSGVCICNECFLFSLTRDRIYNSTPVDASSVSVNVRNSEKKKFLQLKEPLCFRCGKEPEKRLLNGEYRCSQCGINYTAGETRDFLIEKMTEAQRRMEQNACVTCGRHLTTPNWCSWCGSEPEPAEHIISNIKERIRAIDAIIDE